MLHKGGDCWFVSVVTGEKKKETYMKQPIVCVVQISWTGRGICSVFFYGMLWILLLWWLCDAKCNDGNWFIENGGVATRSFSCTLFHTGGERSSIFGPLSLFDERCWFLCNEHVQTSFVCVWIFFSHLYGIYLVPINCDSLRLGCGQGHCAMTSLTFLYMDEANNHIKTSFCQ